MLIEDRSTVYHQISLNFVLYYFILDGVTIGLCCKPYHIQHIYILCLRAVRRKPWCTEFSCSKIFVFFIIFSWPMIPTKKFFYTPWFSDLEHDYKRQENVEYNQVVATTQVLENYSRARGIENCHRHVLWQ